MLFQILILYIWNYEYIIQKFLNLLYNILLLWFGTIFMTMLYHEV